METQRKKLLFVITKSNFGGAQRYVYELATHLPKETFEVVVACGGNGLLVEKLNQAGIKTRIIHSFARDINIMQEIRSFFELQKIIAEERPDIVHLNSSKAGGTGALCARLAGVPRIIFTAHGWPFFEKRGLLWRLIVWKLSWVTSLLAHAVIVVSEHDRKHARMWGLTHKISTIHPSTPPIAFKARTEARAYLSERVGTSLEHAFCAITIAEHTHTKNLIAGIKAIALHNTTHDKKIHYVLIGAGELTEELKAYTQENCLDEYIHFAGYIDDARSYLTAGDVFLLPSTKEGFPYAITEALHAGLPIIASNVGGIPETITHEVTGLLVPQNDVPALSTAISRIANNATLRATLSEHAKKRSQDFSFEQMNTKTLAIYLK